MDAKASIAPNIKTRVESDSMGKIEVPGTAITAPRPRVR